MQIVPAQCGIARLGGCYDYSTHALTCNFNSTFCEATCLERNEDGRSCKQWGPRPTWKKPSELRMGQYGDCVCQTTHVGSCYTVQTDHKATCHLHRSQCPPDTIWIASGYRFGSHSQNPEAGTYCMCHDNRGVHATQFGVCKKDIQSRCSLDAGHCEPGETWIDPQVALSEHNIECPSFNVEVGACKAQDGTETCAVDADSCMLGDTWMSPSLVKANGLDCKLDEVSPSSTPSPPSPSAPSKKSNFMIHVTVVMPGKTLTATDKELLKRALADIASVDVENINLVKTSSKNSNTEYVYSFNVANAEAAGFVATNFESKEPLDYKLETMDLPKTISVTTSITDKPARGRGLGPGAIVGIVLGGIAALVGTVIGVAVWMRYGTPLVIRFALIAAFSSTCNRWPHFVKSEYAYVLMCVHIHRRSKNAALETASSGLPLNQTSDVEYASFFKPPVAVTNVLGKVVEGQRL